jgi:hypothetical protein
MADETVVSWRAIAANIRLVASDGKEVGKVLDVAALPEEDIFHGVVYKSQQTGHTVLAPRDDIDRITPGAIYLSVDSEQAKSHEPFHAMHVEKLGLKGLFFWKHTGWKDSSE